MKLKLNRKIYIKLGVIYLNRVTLVVLKECTTTWGLQNTPPPAAVENISQ